MIDHRPARQRQRDSKLRPARLRPLDVARVGAIGLRTRPVRAALSALGIAIGIAAMVAVVGITASSRLDLAQRLERYGTNLLTVTPGVDLKGDQARLPAEAVDMVARIPEVEHVSATGKVNTTVYRTDRVPAANTNGIAVLAARTDLRAPVGATLADGAWLNTATERTTAVVLGATAARYLGIHTAGPDVRVWLGGQWFTVIGILAPVPLAAELDTAVFVGWPVARDELGFDGYMSTLYTRIAPNAVDDVRAKLGRTVSPEHPNEVRVERPSDALRVKEAADQTFTALLLGLGAVALLVGGVGVANTMIISVLERRGEIGWRRALGATKGQIRIQFLTEALLLSALGGAGGVLLGVAVTTSYALTQGWPVTVPGWAQATAVAATLVIGGIAGLYPAIRAARLAPTEALAVP
ncbi:ABC transporter permease [Dactylosporangium fulvum]|uniref:ABC transporter permease n=1 Tax=Dactylosporangium fulvum TaxID=53359 RepID=A0ABY5VS51_9ACTN|nr:ABC transporter permease [Dactylosporangium fulvum]UWP80015.1 ABC transporter permease [Dactylosporangium fulvum]